MERIARVFPRRTSMTPTDDLAFTGYPTIEARMMEIDRVDISVTFSWDMETAEDLYEQWQALGVPVDIGGPAFGDRMGDFTPGKYVKEGCVFTSRGCTKDCWFCSVPACSHGVVRELPIYDGYNIMDDNILATSREHFTKVMGMLKRQPQRAIFSGGLEPAMLTEWHAAKLHEVKPQRIYTAYDTKDDYEAIRSMAKKLWDAGFRKTSHQIHCYVLCGYEGDTFEEAEKRCQQVCEVGFLPFAMLYRDETGRTEQEWRGFQREWANAIIVGKKFAEIQKEL